MSFILMISWGGESTYGWTSPPLVGMGVLSVVLATLFLLWETRAAEPILPLRLFRNPIFRVIVPLMVLLGSMMYGANAFLPLFLQAVNGVSATQSGLLMLPLMLGVTISSIGSGRLTAITGRYKQWPIIGMGLVTAGTAILARMDATTSTLLLSLGMLLLGLGMGMTMPTSTLAVQNSVEFRDMGVGTSMVTFFRSLGGAIGLAAYGAVFNAQIVSSGINQALLQAPDKIHEPATRRAGAADQRPVERRGCHLPRRSAGDGDRLGADVLPEGDPAAGDDGARRHGCRDRGRGRGDRPERGHRPLRPASGPPHPFGHAAPRR